MCQNHLLQLDTKVGWKDMGTNNNICYSPFPTQAQTYLPGQRGTFDLHIPACVVHIPVWDL